MNSLPSDPVTPGGGAVHIPGMKTSCHPARPELLCIVCSGGAADRNGAYTVCALCELDGQAPLTVPAAA